MNYDAKIDAGQDEGGERAASLFGGHGEDDRIISRRMLIVAAVIVAVLIGLWFLNRFNQPADLAAAGQSQAPVVTVVSPGRTAVVGDINATGTLAARRELPVGVVGDGGQIVRVLVEPGDWVKAGQVLAVIDSSVQSQQAAGMAAQVAVAEADSRLAQSNLERALKLVERGFISKADVDRLTAKRDAENARVLVARARFAERRARNSRLNITAPAAGLLLERNAEPAEVVRPGSGVLFRIAQGGEMELLANLGEDDLAKISVGATAEVTPVGLDNGFTGQIWQISPVIDPKDRQGTARIALPYSPQLRPGGFANAKISSGGLVAPKLPGSAILSDEKGSYVYIVGKDNKVKRRDVQTGAISADSIAVVKGISGRERIVLRAGAFLSPGETVKPKVAGAP
ncbi:MAG: efflux RND transporter periplasmic adaptor subunit [Sphingomonadaceae bacterium]|nr:efflux RND transporter periplasmic adaptor subunit [Sphingomonadaceae bacterium]